MKTFFGIAIAIIVLCNSTVFAQDTLRSRYGVFGGLSINAHSADFRALPGVPNCCPKFGSGTGVGPLFGLFYEMPLAIHLLFSLSASYVDHSALLSTTEPVAVSVAGVLQNASFAHTVDATLSSIGVEPAIKFNLAGGLFVSGGFRIGAMISKSYTQKEVTNTGTFLDSVGNDTKKSTRNQNSGDLPSANTILLQGFIGASYELPINSSHTTFLVPTVSYALGFTDVVNGISWKPNGIRASVGITFSPRPSIPKPVIFDTIIVADTTTVFVESLNAPTVRLTDTRYEHSTNETDIITELTTVHKIYLHEKLDPHLLRASVQAFGLDDEENETPMATLQIEEFLQIHSHPLLGYIFFSDNSSEIPERYQTVTKSEARDFKLDALFGLGDIEVHHNVLNIIGRRMKDYPKSSITLTGCNNDVGREKNNVDLSKARAEKVKSYLVEVWNIDASRIKTASRNLPEIPSSSKSEDGQGENRRVEITSDEPNVTDVFTATDTTRQAAPPQIRFRTTRVSASPIVSWSLTVLQKNQVLTVFSGKGTPPDSLDWDLINDQKHVPHFSEPLTLNLSIRNSIGDEKNTSTTLQTQVRTIEQKRRERAKDVSIDKYNLVLFNFGKSDMTPAHQRILTTVKSRLKPNSQIVIEGYTDRTGTSASNVKLATSRAKATADALGRTDAKVVGIGDRRLLHPNDTPEGRFFCRTVQITARTPVE